MFPNPLCDHTCILTMQADRPGGIPTVIDWWYTFLTGWGHSATVLYAAFPEGNITLWERLATTARMWRVHPRPEHPNPTLASAAPPVPLWLIYFVPQWIFGPVLDRFEQIVVAGGPCLAALPLALRQLPFVLWMGTLYEDELKGKALVDDAWAKRILNNPCWPFLAWQERLVMRRASRILSQSPYTHRRIVETAPEVEDRLDLVMVPIDTDIYHPLPPIERHPSEQYILSVCRVNDPRKNIPMLLEAFSKVLEHHPNLKLALVGDAPNQALLDCCKRLSITQSVDFRGKVEKDELVTLYQQAALFVIASAQEGLGIVMLEAMACGLPVVATDCGGPEGIVITGETGSLAPNNDPDALAQAVIDLLDNPDALEPMREQCVAFVREHCARQVVEQQLYEHFTAVFSDSDAARRKIFDIPDTERTRDLQTVGLSPLPDVRPNGVVRAALAAVWAVFVFVVYMQHQMTILWPSIRDNLLPAILEAVR